MSTFTEPAPGASVDIAAISHPSARRTTVVLLAGAVFAALEAIAIGLASGPVFAAPLGLLSVGAVALTVRLRTTFKATAVHNRATDLILRGDVAGAESMLQPFARLGGAVGQSIALQLATISLLRGDMVTAEQRATRSLEKRPRLDFAMTGRALEDLGRSIRAFARAAQGDVSGAQDDIRQVRVECKQASPLARVAVAELLLFSRDNKTEELSAALVRNERVLEHAAPRERALVRGFERLVAVGGGAIYRRPQSRVSEEGEAAAWLSSVAPAVRGFLAAEARKVGTPAPLPGTAISPGRAPELRPSTARRRRWKVVALWLVLVALFVFIWQLLAPPAGHHAVPSSVPETATHLGVVYGGLSCAILFLFGIVTIRIRAVRAKTRRSIDLESQALLGDANAVRDLELVTRDRLPALSAAAFLSLSRVKLLRGAFRYVLADAEAGLNLVDTSPALRNAYSDILVPGLHVQRGLALAGMGRAEEAEAECVALVAGFPGYAYLSAGVLRIRLLAAARQCDFVKANAIAKTRSADLPLTAKEELLCAMLSLVEDPEKDEAEERRVLAVLKRSEETRAFVKQAAPGLAEAVGHLPSDHKRVDTADDRDPESSEADPVTTASSAG